MKNACLYLTSFLFSFYACTNIPEAPALEKWGTHYTWSYPNAEMDSAAWAMEYDTMKMAGIDEVLMLLREHEPGYFEKVMRWGKQAGLKMHVWIPTMNPHGNDSTEIKHPEWYIVRKNGVSCLEDPPYIPGYKWLCPTKPAVRAYLKKVMGEWAEKDYVEGVHLDYIRLPDIILPVGIQPRYNLVQDKEYPEFDFCYCQDCVGRFKEEYDIDIMAVEDPSTSEEWKVFRYKMISEVVAEIRSVVEPKGKVLTAAVFPFPELARTLVRQDWANWSLDAVMPMMYHQYYNEPISWIGECTQIGTTDLNGKFPLHSGLFVREIPPDSMAYAVQVAKENGAAGICLFNSNSMSGEQWMALRDALFVKKEEDTTPAKDGDLNTHLGKHR